MTFVRLIQIDGGDLIVAAESVSALRGVSHYRNSIEGKNVTPLPATQVYCHGTHIANVHGSPVEILAAMERSS